MRISAPCLANMMIVVISLLLYFVQHCCCWELQALPQTLPPPKFVDTRRSVCNKSLRALLLAASGSLGATFASASSLQHPAVAHAACLPGDVSKECIGVYKVPATPSSKSSFGMPQSYDDAWQVLDAQRLATNDIVQVVRAGRLEEAGVKVLNLLPRVSMAGKWVIQTIMERENKGSTAKTAVVQELEEKQLETALNDVLISFNECDIMIGQGLRGEMGAVTVAQVLILKELEDAIRGYDNFLAIANKFSRS
ncbi:hypothetical protein ACA910_015198 [Epithemia clementina (nom. ined.)]